MNLDLIIVSIVEGITEFIPVSSTAHIILFSKILSIDTTSQYIKFYSLFIQAGALLAGILLFSKRIFTDKKVFRNVCISFVPTAVLGFLLYKMFKILLEGNMILISIVLILGGVILIYLEKVFLKKRSVTQGVTDINEIGRTEIGDKDAFYIGLAQAIAIVPGVSRSGATIATGIFMGIKKSVIVEYTFILAIPTIAAAVLYDVYKSREVLYAINNYNDLIAGFIVSFASAFVVLYLFKRMISRISLTMFGWYRIILAIIILFIFI